MCSKNNIVDDITVSYSQIIASLDTTLQDERTYTEE
jgi:hypothetical protein